MTAISHGVTGGAREAKGVGGGMLVTGTAASEPGRSASGGRTFSPYSQKRHRRRCTHAGPLTAVVGPDRPSLHVVVVLRGSCRRPRTGDRAGIKPTGTRRTPDKGKVVAVLW